MTLQQARDGDGAPIPGVRIDPARNVPLPTIDEYDDQADLPAAYNALSEAAAAEIGERLTHTTPSTAPGTVGYRRIFISPTPPAGAVDGDIWLQT